MQLWSFIFICSYQTFSVPSSRTIFCSLRLYQWRAIHGLQSQWLH